jgi:ribosomal protein S25
MARKSQLSKATHAVKNLAGKAKRQLSHPGNAAKTIAGAAPRATIAATGVVAKKVADAVSGQTSAVR